MSAGRDSGEFIFVGRTGSMRQLHHRGRSSRLIKLIRAPRLKCVRGRDRYIRLNTHEVSRGWRYDGGGRESAGNK